MLTCYIRPPLPPHTQHFVLAILGRCPEEQAAMCTKGMEYLSILSQRTKVPITQYLRLRQGLRASWRDGGTEGGAG
jgi:hypothetical protein